MKDTEIIKCIAEKVMGWECDYPESIPKGVISPDCKCLDECKNMECEMAVTGFNPLTSDADCMMAWDEFSKERVTIIERILDDTGWWWCAEVDRCVRMNPDRKRAMCECMVKAVA